LSLSFVSHKQQYTKGEEKTIAAILTVAARLSLKYLHFCNSL